MPRTLCYADAVKLLGGRESPVVVALDRLTGGLLLAFSGSGGAFALSLFDARGELARLSGELVSGLGDRLRGLGRLDRTERLMAAHQVIVLTAYFEATCGVEAPFDGAELRLGRSAQVAVAAGEQARSGRLRNLAGILTGSDVPGVVQLAADQVGADELRGYYASLGERLLGYLEGLAAWTRLDDEARERFTGVCRYEVPEVAVGRYEEHLRRLAVECPEVAFWANRREHAVSRSEIRRLGRGMEGLERALREIASGRPPDERRQGLTARYRRTLQRPIVETGEVPDGLVLPTLAEAYVSPAYRAAPVARSDRLDEEGWWAVHPVHGDLQEFLVGYLTSVTATEAPLIVLGQPGSGKSVLTKVLAARLPAQDFLVVRVALRDVPADADVQSQIEYAVRDETGEQLRWPDLARSADGALPVILLDGFDELLMATGVGQTDYLEQVARFQEREADQGRPVAVIVTSRIAVADRGRIPHSGAVAVRLEPFTEAQVRQWLEVWNGINAPHLASRDLRPIAVSAAMRHRSLAEQPLLLLMLALYDAADNALQREGDHLDEADLYEGILTRFAEREVAKSRPELAAASLRAAVDEELLRLSVAAFAMFNRGRQWATEEEINDDLTALPDITVTRPARASFHSPMTAAQLVIGSFFFVHQARAVRDDRRLTASEFLHATFGEFLIARLIARELADLAAVTAVSTTRVRQTADDGFVRALLSFMPLTTRAQIVAFLSSLITTGVAAGDRQVLRDLLLASFRTALAPQRLWVAEGYAPVHLTAPARHAALSANLLLLATLVGSPINGRELFPEEPYSVSAWRRHTMLWRSQFSIEGWRSLVNALRLERTWHNDDREIVLSRDAGRWDPPHLDPLWFHNLAPSTDLRIYDGWRHMRTSGLRRESYFTCDQAEDVAWHAVEPFTLDKSVDDPDNAEATAEAPTEFGVLYDDPPWAASITHALLRLWFASSGAASRDELEAAYRTCINVIDHSRPQEDIAIRKSHYSRVLRQLAADADRVTPQFRQEMHDIFKDLILTQDHLSRHPELCPWANGAFHDLPGQADGQQVRS